MRKMCLYEKSGLRAHGANMINCFTGSHGLYGFKTKFVSEIINIWIIKTNKQILKLVTLLI